MSAGYFHMVNVLRLKKKEGALSTAYSMNIIVVSPLSFHPAACPSQAWSVWQRDQRCLGQGRGTHRAFGVTFSWISVLTKLLIWLVIQPDVLASPGSVVEPDQLCHITCQILHRCIFLHSPVLVQFGQTDTCRPSMKIPSITYWSHMWSLHNFFVSAARSTQ